PAGTAGPAANQNLPPPHLRPAACIGTCPPASDSRRYDCAHGDIGSRRYVARARVRAAHRHRSPARTRGDEQLHRRSRGAFRRPPHRRGRLPRRGRRCGGVAAMSGPACVARQSRSRITCPAVRGGAVALLLRTLLARLVGTANPLANINMTLFWVAFLLGFTYFTAIAGNIFALVNPWRTLVEWTERLGLDLSTSRVTYPSGLGYLPAFAFYVALVWIELFTLPQ